MPIPLGQPTDGFLSFALPSVLERVLAHKYIIPFAKPSFARKREYRGGLPS